MIVALLSKLTNKGAPVRGCPYDFFSIIPLALITDRDIAMFSLLLFGILAGLVAYFFVSFWKSNRRMDVSPYTGLPLRSASELTYATKDKLSRYLQGLKDFENRDIDLDRAAFCRETGRIFPECVTWTGAIKIDWTFIAKRFKGDFVSWGSLSAEKKREVRDAHGSLEGFQTEFSSKIPSPRLVEESLAVAKPGPLYVDPETKILMGWKEVPGTGVEVLFVQKPIKVKLLNIKDKTK